MILHSTFCSGRRGIVCFLDLYDTDGTRYFQKLMQATLSSGKLSGKGRGRLAGIRKRLLINAFYWPHSMVAFDT